QEARHQAEQTESRANIAATQEEEANQRARQAEEATQRARDALQQVQQERAQITSQIKEMRNQLGKEQNLRKQAEQTLKKNIQEGIEASIKEREEDLTDVRQLVAGADPIRLRQRQVKLLLRLGELYGNTDVNKALASYKEARDLITKLGNPELNALSSQV